MKKKIVLLSIIIFPSLIYFVFELTQANFKKMAYYGPKKLDAKGDTVYWSVPDTIFGKCSISAKIDTCYHEKDKPFLGCGDITPHESLAKYFACDSFLIDTNAYPVYCMLFLDKKLHNVGYKLDGLLDYVRFKKTELKDVPIFFISSMPQFNEVEATEEQVRKEKNFKRNLDGEFDSIPIKLPNFISARLPVENRDSFLKETYFKQKPIHVFNYFMVLVDKKRHIRGYYDPTFNAEVKRMIQEYKHLKIRDEYGQTLKQNTIKQKDAK